MSRAYGLSFLFEKTRKSNRMQMLLQGRTFFSAILKTLSVSLAGVRASRLPRSRPGANPIELTGISGIDCLFQKQGFIFWGTLAFHFFGHKTFLHVLQVVCVPQQMVVQLS